jgi:hypothetical protein
MRFLPFLVSNPAEVLELGGADLVVSNSVLDVLMTEVSLKARHYGCCRRFLIGIGASPAMCSTI